MEPYQDSREHLFEELRRLDLLLNVHLERVRRDPARQHFDHFRGLFISEAEIDAIVPRESTDMNLADTASAKALTEQIRCLEQRIAERTASSLEEGLCLRLLRLAELFSLTPFDLDALLICLAPELDTKYGKLYAYLQDDATRRSAGVELILGVLCGSTEEKLQGRLRLGSGAPLVHHGLVLDKNHDHVDATGFLSRTLTVDPRILNFLLEIEEPDAQLKSLTKLVVPGVSLEEAILPSAIKEGAARYLLSLAQAEGGSAVMVLQGKVGAGKKHFAEALCHALGRQLLVADLRLMAPSGAPSSALITRILREALFRHSVIYLDHAESVSTSAEQDKLSQILEEYRGIIFIGSETAWGNAKNLPAIELPLPDCDVRQQLWHHFLRQGGHNLPTQDELIAIADKFSFNPGAIRSAVERAEQLARVRGGAPATITLKDLYAACRAQSASGLVSLARKISPIYSWPDIILPADQIEQLREICTHVQHRHRVFSGWGFDRKFSLGKGLHVLFAGPSGTGKTLTAEIMASELGLDLYKVDLASLVSKYIGETEKNLKMVFEEAEQSNAMLFFDEADAIFGKRTEVKDSHDRYANTEVNYLLQKMEEYSGTVILATNLRKNIDDAFLRRLRFVVEFPFPEEEYRLRIWKAVFPKDTPLGSDIDFSFLAGRLKVPGGAIRNIALQAAFLAAADGGIVRMEQIMRAARREFQKMGRMCVKADFGPYMDLPRGVM